jgi:hypothetical protein
MKPIAVTGQIHSNQTGRFPITFSRGSKYMMVVYDYDSNAILTKPLTSRTETELLQTGSNLFSNALITKPPAACNLTCAPNPLPSNSFRLTTINVTPRKKPSALGKTILLLASAALIPTFRCISGVDSFHELPRP